VRLLFYGFIAKNGSKQVKKDKWTGQGQVKNVNQIHGERILKQRSTTLKTKIGTKTVACGIKQDYNYKDI
jgi:hypothetical protein